MSKTRVNISYSIEMSDIPDKVSQNIDKISLCPSEFKDLLDLFYNSLENKEFDLACAALSNIAHKSDAIMNVSEDNLSILEGYRKILEQKDNALRATEQKQQETEDRDD